MSGPTKAQLQARIDELEGPSFEQRDRALRLEAENQALYARIAELEANQCTCPPVQQWVPTPALAHTPRPRKIPAPVAVDTNGTHLERM